MAKVKQWGVCVPYLLKAISEHQSDDCLLWPFRLTTCGYGQIQYEGKRQQVHRIAYKVTHGEWPEPYALHKCDNPQCFNPRHITAGTRRDNVADMIRKGRQRSGSGKLTAEIVREIRATFKTGDRNFGGTALARKYGVNNNTICSIMRGKSWRHLITEVDSCYPKFPKLGDHLTLIDSPNLVYQFQLVMNTVSSLPSRNKEA